MRIAKSLVWHAADGFVEVLFQNAVGAVWSRPFRCFVIDITTLTCFFSRQCGWSWWHYISLLQSL